MNFAIIYGVTAFGLSRGLDMSPKQAQEFLDRFFARHPRVQAYLDAHRRGGARARLRHDAARPPALPAGAARAATRNLRGFAERMATNAPIQGTAADLIKIAMVRMAAGAGARAASRAACCCRCTTSCSSRRPPPSSPRLEALAREVMESAMSLDVPLKVDVKTGADWAHGVRRFLLVGLTGGIATGKSTVSRHARRARARA